MLSTILLYFFTALFCAALFMLIRSRIVLKMSLQWILLVNAYFQIQFHLNLDNFGFLDKLAKEVSELFNAFSYYKVIYNISIWNIQSAVSKEAYDTIYFMIKKYDVTPDDVVKLRELTDNCNYNNIKEYVSKIVDRVSSTLQ